MEFAYNIATYSATKQSPFQIVYGFNPLTPMDLTPLPQAEAVSLDRVNKAGMVKKLHQNVKDNLKKKRHNSMRSKLIRKEKKLCLNQENEFGYT